VRASQVAFGSRGGMGVTPSVNSSFSSSPPPPSSPPLVHGVVDGDETPRRLGSGAHGGAVAAYL
jgi:hypothetical protein